MVNDTSQKRLLAELQELVQAHRRALKQERPFLRSVGLVLGEVFNFGRHTVTQDLLTLGMSAGDWSGWYRLFSCERYEEEQLSTCLLEETLKQVQEGELYGVVLDSTVVHRSSLKMPGTSWLRDSRFCAFRPGIHRGQRFVHAAWLPPLEEGYSRAILLRFLPALPPKAVAASVPVRQVVSCPHYLTICQLPTFLCQNSVRIVSSAQQSVQTVGQPSDIGLTN